MPDRRRWARGARLGCEDFDRPDEARFVGNLARHKQAVRDQCAEISMAISKAPMHLVRTF
jgi:hypothetical protein